MVFGQASIHRTFDSYTTGDAEGLRASQEDLARMVRTTHQPFWRWTALVWRTTTLLLSCDFRGAADCSRESRELEQTFDVSHGSNEGPWSLQSFMIRRETGGLEFARAILDRVAPMPHPWRPGIVALGTELGVHLTWSIQALREALERDLPSLRASSSWPAGPGIPDRGCHLPAGR